MPSSSGGDEESISSFLNSNNPSPHQQINLTNQNPTFFNPHHSSHNQYNDESNINNNPHHVIWSGNYLRPESNLQNLINNNPSSSSLLLPSSSKSQSTIIINEASFPNPSPSVVPKNPKKRTRASRRAPTTVLTTDTSNFRQMVQEFTGIPTVPLSSPFTNRRSFDLFPGGPHFNTLLGPSSSPSLSYSNMIGTSSNNTATSKSDNFQMPFEYHNQYYLNQQNASMNYGGLNHDGTSLVAAPTLQDHDESSSQQVMERYYTNNSEK